MQFVPAALIEVEVERLRLVFQNADSKARYTKALAALGQGQIGCSGHAMFWAAVADHRSNTKVSRRAAVEHVVSHIEAHGTIEPLFDVTKQRELTILQRQQANYASLALV